MTQYCHSCGKEKRKIPSGTYNTQTGEENYYYRCVDDCAHGKHAYTPDTSLISALIGYKCPECGKRYRLSECGFKE